MHHKYSDDFLAFWRAYPKKVCKVAAWKKWQIILRDPTISAEQIILAAKQFAKSRQGSGDSQFVPHPTTWLNQGRYEDEINPRDELDPFEKAILNVLEQESGSDVRDPLNQLLSIGSEAE